MTNEYAEASEPKIRIEGSGDAIVTINAQQMAFTGLTDGIIVDSELKDCMNLSETALMNANATMDEFPLLAPGANMISISGAVTKITVTPRWRVR